LYHTLIIKLVAVLSFVIIC